MGITGGIAAYKACELLRRLQDQGAQVRVVMTCDAQRFVGSLTFEALSGFPVYRPEERPSAFSHIEYSRWADLFLIAPCTATSLARFAAGMADEPLSLCFCASDIPKVVAPAMNQAMWHAPAVQKNLQLLISWGVRIVEPSSGLLACGEDGAGRLAEIGPIIEAVKQHFSAKNIPFIPEKTPRGTVLITAGRTEEAIDPVRYISNRSSGKTSLAIARAFLDAGFAVELVHGPMDVPAPPQCSTHFTVSAREMHDKVLELAPLSQILILCAAVADFRPANPSPEKIKASRQMPVLELEANPNILHSVVKNRLPGQIIVGFALETDQALEHAKNKWKQSGADFLVVNTPVRKDSGFGQDKVEYALLLPNQIVVPALKLDSKEKLASEVLTQACKLLGDFT